MVSIQCPSCRRIHQAPESIVGREVKCKDCGASFVAQPSAGAPEAAAPRPTAQQAPSPARPRPQLLKPLLIAGGVVVVLGGLACILLLVVMPMLAGGLPSWTKDYIPKNATKISFTNYADMRKGAESMGQDEKELEKMGKGVGESQLKAEDVEAVLDVTSKSVRLTVIRAAEDMDLNKAFDYKKDDVKKTNDREYAKIGNQGYACKTADRTFCLSSGEGAEDNLKDLIKRLDKGETYDVPEDLQEVLDYVASTQEFTAEVSTAAGEKAKGAGKLWGTTIESKSITIYEKEKTAEDKHKDLVKAYDENIEEIEKALDKADRDDRDKVEAYLHRQAEDQGKPTLDGAAIKRSGSVSVSKLKTLLGLDADASYEKLLKAEEDAEEKAQRLIGGRRNTGDDDR